MTGDSKIHMKKYVHTQVLKIQWIWIVFIQVGVGVSLKVKIGIKERHQ